TLPANRRASGPGSGRWPRAPARASAGRSRSTSQTARPGPRSRPLIRRPAGAGSRLGRSPSTPPRSIRARRRRRTGPAGSRPTQTPRPSPARSPPAPSWTSEAAEPWGGSPLRQRAAGEGVKLLLRRRLGRLGFGFAFFAGHARQRRNLIAVVQTHDAYALRV